MNWQSTRTKARRYVPVEPEREAPGIEIVGGVSRGRFIVLSVGTHVIGRTEDAAIQLADEGVSRRHAKLRVDDDGTVHVIDLDSRNGTYLNGEPVGHAKLQIGDRIQIGSAAVLRLTYRVASDAIAPSQPVQVPLSPRELDIARLVAAGATNAEIADRLSISPKTVSAHLVNVFERLGIHKRAQLARYVTEHGLLE